MPDPHATPDRARVDSPADLRLPTLRRLWREWRCGRKHPHGPDGYYKPLAVQANPSGSRVWLQECQACGRFTCWFEDGRQ